MNFLKWFSLIPAIEAAVQLVAALPHLQSDTDRQNAAVALVETGLKAGEDLSGRQIADHPAFDAVTRAAIDAIVAVKKLTAKPVVAPAPTS